MSLSDGDIAFAMDLFSDIPDLSMRKMFGGMCLYAEGTVFALQASDGRIFLKTKTPEALFGQSTEQFHSMPYWAVPEDILDDQATATAKAREALDSLR